MKMSHCRCATTCVRTLVTSSRVQASHYDVLGITPKATQNDIKTAYYKLSMLYHPDKSSDETSAKKFRAITEAYEVLGNVNLKKLYDKGLIVGRENTTRVDYQPEPEPTDPTLRFYKSHANRHITPTIDGRIPIYDFDTWSKRHYGNLFAKSQYDKDLLRKKRAKQLDRMRSNRQEAYMYIIFALGGLVTFLYIHGSDDYDTDLLATRRAKAKVNNSTDDNDLPSNDLPSNDLRNNNLLSNN